MEYIWIKYTLKVDNKYFLFGQSYKIKSTEDKLVDCRIFNNDCKDTRQTLMKHYIVEVDSIDYSIPEVACTPVSEPIEGHDIPRQELADRKYQDKTFDMVKEWKKATGIDISAKQREDKADYANETKWYSLTNELKKRDDVAMAAEEKRISNLKALKEISPDEISHKEYFIPIVTFDGNGGIPLYQTEKVEEGNTVSELPLVTREGYTFSQWNTQSDGTGTVFTADTVITDSITIYAIWTQITYQITFDANEGTGGEVQTVAYGVIPTAPTVARTGYTFINWSPTVIAATEDTTYTAQWEIITYQITFNADGGTGGETQTVAHGTVPTPPVVTREDYTFVAWSPLVVAATEAATYTATWDYNYPEVGDTYEGGTIFYVLQVGDPGYEAEKVKGLIAYPEDISGTKQWGDTSQYVNDTSLDIGTGAANTTRIVSILGSYNTGDYAAKLCNDLTDGVYSDWYLPSRNELQKMQINKTVVPGITTNGFYWSSTEYTVDNSWKAWLIDFGTGTMLATYDKNSAQRVRAIRSFELVKSTPEVGDTYEGGVVVHILQEGEEGYVAGKYKGLIIKPESIGTSVWSNVEARVNGINSSIGYGAANTLLIINQEGHVNSAAKLCNDYNDGIYSDWYLLTVNDLVKVQDAASFLNLPPGDIFIWTSIQSTLDAEAFKGYINRSGMTNIVKSDVVSVYPMRTFEIVL